MATDTGTVQKVGAYVVEHELGRGAFGVVYRAHHRDDPDTPVALKVVEAGSRLDRVLVEPTLLSTLDHPCVVRLLDYFVHGDNRLVIALEFVGGGDLKGLTDERDRFSPAEVRDLLVQVGGALAAAHARGIAHRDLKPANILLDRAGKRVRYVLTDFGVGGRDEGIRSEKRVAGTYLFMAPEQLRGRPSPQSDLWALGVTAYRMLTGQYPFPGPTLPDLARQIQLTTPPPPSQVTGEPIDPDLERAVLRLLDRSESERIASARQLLDELGHTGDPKDVLAAPADRAATRVAGRQQTLDETLTRGIRRNYVWAGTWAALLLVVTGPASGALLLTGLALFYRAHDRWKRWRWAAGILAAFVVILGSWVARVYADPFTQDALGEAVEGAVAPLFTVLPAELSAITALALAVGWFAARFVAPILFPILACANYARAGRLRRERLLLRAAAAGAASDEYLDVLRKEVEYRYEDVGFHLKYAEALAARGDDRAAAVEARLLLVQDPYNFAGNLLLAQSYQRLGLPADCARVCDNYLAVSGYCFEFAELRRQCGPEGVAA